MNWSILIYSLLFLSSLGWLWMRRRSFRPVEIVFRLICALGILLCIVASYISTLPSEAARKTVIGLATSRSTNSFLYRHRWNFTLIEENTGQRFLFRTEIDGPWADQPVRVTYLDDGRIFRMPFGLKS